MSDYERNKGRLIPFELTEDIAEQLVQSKGDELSYNSYLEQFEDDLSWYAEDVVKIDGDWFKVEWEVERFTDYVEFGEAKMNPDGSIDFHTLHYNSCHWTEVVEDALNG